MSERKTGWYWVKDDVEGWHPAQWLGRWCSPFVIQHGGLSDSDYLEIGPRIPTPDEPWRPDSCRNELQAKCKPYPKSGCAVCGNGGLAGCPYGRNASKEDT